MSYDVYVNCSKCGSDLIRPSGHNNMTGNLSKMWNAAGATLADWEGLTGAEVLSDLQRAIDELRNNPEDYKPMEASNGWGTIENCIEFLERIRNACCRDLTAMLHVCR